MIKNFIGKIAAGVAVTFVFTMAATGPASADPYDHHDRGWHGDREWREHERYTRQWRKHHTYPVYTDVYAPPLIVSPPPVYYPARQPVYVAPAEPSFNFIIPLHIH